MRVGGSKRILLVAGCVLLLAVSWLIAITAQSDAQRQEELLQQASSYLQDEIYVRAIPLLEEAASYEDTHTMEAEEVLKDCYLQMIDQSGYEKKYTDLLEKQMAREDAAPDCFEEAARYYLDQSDLQEALTVLRDGVSKTGSEELETLYEQERYQYQMEDNLFQDVTAIYNGAVQVKKDNHWGLANAAGEIVIPCVYDWISTYSNGEAIAKKGAVISGIDGSANRVALHHGEASTFSNFAENRVGLKTEEGWLLADGEFNTGSIYFEELGMFSDGGAPAKLDGKWGILDISGGDWLIAPEYDGVIQDELGRSYRNDTVFVKSGSQVLLLVDGEQVGESYEDARPFADGWAAVKKNGTWGFIDQEGVIQIDYQFEDARSFGQHLAAVKVNGKWGYVSLKGEIAIEPSYLDAGSFSDGSAPVRTEAGWRFITLLEYEEGTGL